MVPWDALVAPHAPAGLTAVPVLGPAAADLPPAAFVLPVWRGGQGRVA